MSYVFNMVLVPFLTYRLQIYILQEKECDPLMAPIRKIFKHKLKFASTAPTYLTQNKAFYNLFNLWQIQAQCQSINLTTFFNSNSLIYDIAKIRLFHLQQKLEMNSSLINTW